MTIPFKRDEIVILLGAGASVEADIPATQGMIKKIEQLLNERWSDYRDLYYFVKSAIHFTDGIRGRFDTSTFNVEQLVSTLDDLRRGDDHPLSPFVGAWVPRLYQVAGSDLYKVTAFRDAIVRQLRDDWVQLEYVDDAAYYSGLIQFQRELQFPIRLFTLNYDLCVESTLTAPTVVRGFDAERKWDWRLFEEGRDAEPDFYLYKLHGSIDWTYDANGWLTYRDAISQIDPEKLAIIFGATYKLQYIDPFLFCAYEFRRWTLELARLIVAVGYGFIDEHINGILRQSLGRDSDRRLLAITWLDAENEDDRRDKERQRSAEFARALDLKNADQVICWGCGAKEFMTNRLTLEQFSTLFPTEADLFEEIQPSSDVGPDSGGDPAPQDLVGSSWREELAAGESSLSQGETESYQGDGADGGPGVRSTESTKRTRRRRTAKRKMQ